MIRSDAKLLDRQCWLNHSYATGIQVCTLSSIRPATIRRRFSDFGLLFLRISFREKMSSLSPTSLVRSSLEEMLENIRRRNEKTKDMPPVLPSRPTSRARLPSARRSLPTNFRISEKETASDGKEAKRTSDVDAFKRLNAFGRKKIRSDQVCEDSPYSGWDSQEATAGQRSGDLSAVASTSRSIVVRDDNIEYFFKKKLRVWCRLSSGHWDSGTIQSISDEFVSVGLSTGNAVKVPRGDLLPANPDILDGVDDLTQLSYLNEPSILHNLQHRYLNNMIYGKAGPVLIAVNPFKDVEIYGANYISSYSKMQTRAPHVYAVSEAAYDEMMKVGVDQSILISGESGAGKTETAKIAMQYLACVGGGGDGVEHKMLQTSHILEAFGNAKTSRNDNSSRFGKFIKIQFSTTGKICGAVIQTYLLEKSRVVQLAKGERSYHIFYQLCDGASSVLRDKMNIKTASDYYYLNQGNCLTIGGVDDADEYHKLMEALDILRVSKEEQESFLSVLASILWLGNIKFEVIDNENHVQVVVDEAVTTAAKLMECSVQDLMQVLTTDTVKADNISVAKNCYLLTLQQAMETRDALAKFIYASLFDWLIDQINKSLAFGKCCSGRAINILDIYGFETFQRNSFEQLCINYANERLQQHFNRHLFKLEQEEYESDEVGWTKVEFEDNQDCLNLFEKKQQGLLSLLDEESYFPNATDLTFADKLKLHLPSNPCFKAEGDGKFSIRHCAGEVLYDTTGFLEKNRDMLPSEFILTLLSCSSPLLQSFAFSVLNQCQESLNAAQYGVLDIQKRSVGIKFKDHMYRLMQCLESTTPHFICCIKPNHKQLPGMYEMDLVAQQLKSCGILEVVRIARSGYPSRIAHQEFAQRYGFLLLDRKVPEDPLSISLAVLQQLNIPPEMYQVGYMKLYFRTVQVGGVESTRKRILQSVIGLQKCFRGYKARRQYHEVRTVANLQSYIRGEISRRKYTSFSKKNKAGVHSQKHKHKRSVPKADDQQKSVVQLQSAIRGALARRQAQDMQSQKHDMNSMQNDNHDPISVSDELNRQAEKAEATLARLKEENAALKVQLQQYENQLAEYEVKMRSLEEMWQKQVESLQASLTTAKSSLAPPSNVSDQAGRLTYSPSLSPRHLDSDNSSSFDRTPGALTPFISSSSPPLEASGGEDLNGTSNPVNHLAREFEQRRQGFDEDAKALLEANRSSANPDDEFQRLKMRFTIWKKEYKNRLRETKGMMHKQGNAETERKARRWWGKLSQKRS